jgi:hypothetical protein
MYEDVVALALLLPLDPTLRLPDSLGTPESLCLQHCTRILETSEPYWEICPADRRSLSDVYPLCHAASMVLVHSPSSQHACDLFERATLLLSRYMDDFPLVLFLLQALNSIAACSRLALSDNALEVSRRLRLSAAQLSDIPVALALPLSLEILESMSEGGLRNQRMGIEVGELMNICTGLETSFHSGYQ